MQSESTAFERLANAARPRDDVRPAFAAAFLAHGLIIALLVFLALQAARQTKPEELHFIPVSLVPLSENASSPVAEKKAAAPAEAKPRAVKAVAASPTPPVGERSAKQPAPLDNIDAKLRSLSKLSAPQTNLAIPNDAGTADDDVSNGAPGDHAAYAVRDYVRAQILRRWNLDLSTLGKKNFKVALRIVLTQDGVIESAEIVDQSRFATDAIFHSVSLSARNAALLSSPMKLPAGDYEPEMHMVLTLDPRQTQQ